MSPIEINPVLTQTDQKLGKCCPGVFLNRSPNYTPRQNDLMLQTDSRISHSHVAQKRTFLPVYTQHEQCVSPWRPTADHSSTNSYHEKALCGVRIQKGMLHYQQEFWHTAFFHMQQKRENPSTSSYLTLETNRVCRNHKQEHMRWVSMIWQSSFRSCDRTKEIHLQRGEFLTQHIVFNFLRRKNAANVFTIQLAHKQIPKLF